MNGLLSSGAALKVRGLVWLSYGIWLSMELTLISFVSAVWAILCCLKMKNTTFPETKHSTQSIVLDRARSAC